MRVTASLNDSVAACSLFLLLLACVVGFLMLLIIVDCCLFSNVICVLEWYAVCYLQESSDVHFLCL